MSTIAHHSQRLSRNCTVLYFGMQACFTLLYFVFLPFTDTVCVCVCVFLPNSQFVNLQTHHASLSVPFWQWSIFQLRYVHCLFKHNAVAHVIYDCTGKPKNLCASLYCASHFIAGVWNWICNIWGTLCIKLRPMNDHLRTNWAQDRVTGNIYWVSTSAYRERSSSNRTTHRHQYSKKWCHQMCERK